MDVSVSEFPAYRLPVDDWFGRLIPSTLNRFPNHPFYFQLKSSLLSSLLFNQNENDFFKRKWVLDDLFPVIFEHEL